MTSEDLDALYVESCGVLVDALPIPPSAADTPTERAYIAQINVAMEACMRKAIPDLLFRGRQELALAIAEQYDKHWGAKANGQW